MDQLLKIGNDKEAVHKSSEEFITLVKELKNSEFEQETIRCIVQAFSKGMAVNCSITNCTFRGKYGKRQ